MAETRRLVSTGGTVLLCLAASLPVLAQTTGKIDGRVSDSTGAPLTGVTVEATSPSLPGSRVSVTRHDGIYRLPALPPGTYGVRATLVGFRTAEMAATVTLDGTATADLVLEPAVEDSISVTGEAPLVDTASTTTGTNYTSRVIGYLPTARNYADIVRANPGVSTDRGTTEGRSLTLSIYGATSAENQWIIDGVNTTNVFRGVQGKAINNEFIQEVEVKTGGYQAEYGRALGGIVNVITKSGGNELHGGAFLYFDSTGTAAEQEFKPGDTGFTQMRTDDGDRFDYGFDLGGFLLKDRLWFFGAYNRVTFDARLSRFEASTHVSTDDLFPLDAAENLYSGKLTWNPTVSTSLVGTVFGDPSTTSGASGADPRQGLGALDVTPPVSTDPSTWYSARFQGGTDFGLRATQLLGSRAIVVLQGSYHKDQNSLTPPEGIRYRDQTCADGTPDDPCAFPREDNAVFGGYGFVSGELDHSRSQRQQYAVGLTFYAGDHELRAGGDFQNGRTTALNYDTGGQGVRIRNELGQLYYAHQFLAVSPDDPTPVADYRLAARVSDYGFYLQDSWRISEGLTVNLGLRWDGEQTQNYLGQTVLSFDNEWQPRLGVVWDPWKDGATRIYAFAGRFTYALPTIAAALSFGSGTILQTYNFDPISVAQDPNVIGHEELVVLRTGAYGVPVDAGVRGWYQDELTVGVERLLAPTWTVGLKGTYRTLRNVLEDRCDLDSSLLDGAFCAFMNPGSDGQFASGDFPSCNGLYDDPEWYECYPEAPATPDVSRIYRGIELFTRWTIGASLWLQASFVYSSLRGNYDGGVNQAVYGQTTPSLNSDFDYPALWHNGNGTLALDRTNSFRFDGYWITPWRLSLGLQALVETGAALSRMGYFNDGYGALVFLDPRGSAGRLPTFWGTNLSLGYPVILGPATVTLQAYLFNVFNEQIANAQDESWSTSPPAGFPATIFDPNQEQTNPYFGSVTHRSNPRVFRAAVKVSF